MSIVKEVPEVEAPVLVPEGGIKIPDMMECKSCGYPLYGDDLKSYMNGGDCNICNTPDPDAVAKQSSPEPVVESEPITDKDQIKSTEVEPSEVSEEGGIRVRLCTGPLAGSTFNLPTDKILGREFFNKRISSLVPADLPVSYTHLRAHET